MVTDPLFTLSDAATAVGSEPHTSDSIPIFSVTVDSRRCVPGSLFFALPGTVTDGHEYIHNARDSGAVAAVVTAAAPAGGGSWPLPVVVVPNSLQALQRLAAWYVDTALSGVTRIGVTGSNGKTTTKEMIRSVVAASGAAVSASRGNLNSETGLPLAVFQTDRTAAVAVFEMAMSRPGEMGDLARILRPHYGVITTIGSAHIEFLGSRDAIAREKKAIASCFDGSQTLLVPEGEEYTRFLCQEINGTVRQFGPVAQNAVIRQDSGEVTALEIDGLTATVPLPGRHNGMNALAAWALGRLLQITPEQISKGLAAVTLPGGRNQVFHGSHDRVVMDDSYNASPESMSAALETIAGIHRGRPGAALILVLGAMKELGVHAPEAHRRVLQQVRTLAPDRTILVGNQEWGPALSDTPGITRKPDLCADSSEAARVLAEALRGGETVLIKGSRSLRLEHLREAVNA